MWKCMVFITPHMGLLPVMADPRIWAMAAAAAGLLSVFNHSYKN